MTFGVCCFGWRHLFWILHYDFRLFPPESLHKAGGVKIPLPQFGWKVSRFKTILIKRLVFMFLVFCFNNDSVSITRNVNFWVLFPKVKAYEAFFREKNKAVSGASLYLMVEWTNQVCVQLLQRLFLLWRLWDLRRWVERRWSSVLILLYHRLDRYAVLVIFSRICWWLIEA